eukprot:14430069-Alexandrium_andersonii.AAC.1
MEGCTLLPPAAEGPEARSHLGGTASEQDEQLVAPSARSGESGGHRARETYPPRGPGPALGETPGRPGGGQRGMGDIQVESKT